jgi:hypothetical protein
MRKYCIFLFIFIILSILNYGNFELKFVEKWDHKNETLGHIFFSIIDKDDHIVGTFYQYGNKIINKEKIISIIPRGQGPGDLTNMLALFKYKEGLAFVERPDKMKIFVKKNNNYIWKKTKWFKRGLLLHIVKDGMFYGNKFFFAGFETISIKRNIETAAFLKVYSPDGRPLKSLIKKTYKKSHQQYLMNRYVVPYKNKAILVNENELALYIVSINNLNNINKINLEIPKFYKNMPLDFYIWRKYNKPTENFLSDVETWAMEYSSINKVLVKGNYIIIQIRTCNEKLKKLALLFYDLRSFKLSRILYFNDYLMGEKDDKFYFYANGDPGRDKDAEECIIKIYKYKRE